MPSVFHKNQTSMLNSKHKQVFFFTLLGTEHTRLRHTLKPNYTSHHTFSSSISPPIVTNYDYQLNGEPLSQNPTKKTDCTQNLMQISPYAYKRERERERERESPKSCREKKSHKEKKEKIIPSISNILLPSFLLTSISMLTYVAPLQT